MTVFFTCHSWLITHFWHITGNLSRIERACRWLQSWHDQRLLWRLATGITRIKLVQKCAQIQPIIISGKHHRRIIRRRILTAARDCSDTHQCSAHSPGCPWRMRDAKWSLVNRMQLTQIKYRRRRRWLEEKSNTRDSEHKAMKIVALIGRAGWMDDSIGSWVQFPMSKTIQGDPRLTRYWKIGFAKPNFGVMATS